MLEAGIPFEGWGKGEEGKGDLSKGQVEKRSVLLGQEVVHHFEKNQSKRRWREESRILNFKKTQSALDKRGGLEKRGRVALR